MMILFNPNAAGGKAASKWRRLTSIHPPADARVELCFLKPGVDISTSVRNAIEHGDYRFVAAGGDGTVHELLNSLMRLPETLRRRVVLGAAGLGSSNDFHKPFAKERTVDGIPVCLNFSQTSWRDVGCVQVTHDTMVSLRYFLINASVGITAEGNALFNNPDPLLARLKRYSTRLAIFYAAVRALTAHHNTTFTLRIQNHPTVDLDLTNLGIVKNPHFSGSLRYATTAEYMDGLLKIYAAADMGIGDRLRLLHALSLGRFHHLPGTRSWATTHLTVSASHPFPLELDGEILEAERADFSVVPHAIQVAS
jgi:diacylglycerol kinase (ATP)